MENLYKHKYQKYKSKYVDLVTSQNGGQMDNVICETIDGDVVYKINISIENNMVNLYNGEEIISHFIVNSDKQNKYYLLLNTKTCEEFKLILVKVSEMDTYKWEIHNMSGEVIHKIKNYQETEIKTINTSKKIIILMRHAESEGNVGSKEKNPNLTEKGFQQAEELKTRLLKLKEYFKINDNDSKIYISPLQRTLLTGLPFIKETTIKLHATFLNTEIVRDKSSIGFDTEEEMVNHYNSILNDESRSISTEDMNYDLWKTTIWHDETGKRSSDKFLNIILHRTHLFDQLLEKQPEKIIYVFSHAAFCKFYLENMLKMSSASRENYELFTKLQANTLTNANIFVFRHE